MDGANPAGGRNYLTVVKGLRRMRGTLAVISLVMSLAFSACGWPAPAAQGPGLRGEPGPADQMARSSKTLTIGVLGTVSAMSIAGGRTTSGGWESLVEIYADGLITSDTHSRNPVGRLAERVPSLDDGTMALLPDGRLHVAYLLRKGVTWHDGTPFTANDLVFSTRLALDRGLPVNDARAVRQIETYDVLDDHTFIVHFASPHIFANTLGARAFWVHPQHLLQGAFDSYRTSGDANDLLNLPYWSSGFVHLGAFRLTQFDPGEGLNFEAYDRYYLGQPKLSRIRIQTFGDENTLFSNLLAGSVHMAADGALTTELGHQLKNRWASTGEGRVYVHAGGFRILALQWRHARQLEHANYDPRVRTALYVALDRDALATVIERSPELAAYSLMPPAELAYEATKDGLRQHPYDPTRARSLLEQAGWAPRPDGSFRHTSDGRPFQTAIWSTPDAETELSAIADYWRRLGVAVQEHSVSGAQIRDREYRAMFPGWELTGGSSGDAVVHNQLAIDPATSENRWTGSRHGYDNPHARQLVESYFASVTQRDQFQAMKRISDFVAAELPFLLPYHTASPIAARTGVRVLDDVKGGGPASLPYGNFSRNAYLWEMH